VHGKQGTGYHTIKDDLTNTGGNYIDREVVRDGNIITSRRPSDLPVFAAQSSPLSKNNRAGMEN
jgi:protease I